MMNIKAFVAGSLLGMLGGVKLAHAECDQDFTRAARPSFPGVDHAVDVWGSREQALAASRLCDVDGGFYQAPSDEWVSYCNTARELDVCEDLSNQVECGAMSAEACDMAMGDVYEGCLALAGMTGAVK